MVKIIFIGMSMACGTLVFADADSYRAKAVADASRFVAEKKREPLSVEIRAGTLMDKLGLSRFYKKGDNWTVAVTRVSPGMVHGLDSSRAHVNVYLDPVKYEFRVLDVVNGELARIKVTPEGAAERSITITINKEMKLVGDVAGADFKSIPTGFDAFPIALPDFGQAHLLTSETMRSTREQIESGQNVEFESPDLFRRPVRVLWQRGDLWPAEVETASGISKLVRQEKL